MKHIHFSEVNKKLNELKQSGNTKVLEEFRSVKISKWIKQ